MRLIDGDKLLKFIEERKRPNMHEKSDRPYAYLSLWWAVHDAPTVEVICPNCGALIDGEGKRHDLLRYVKRTAH